MAKVEINTTVEGPLALEAALKVEGEQVATLSIVQLADGTLNIDVIPKPGACDETHTLVHAQFDENGAIGTEIEPADSRYSLALASSTGQHLTCTLLVGCKGLETRQN